MMHLTLCLGLISAASVPATRARQRAWQRCGYLKRLYSEYTARAWDVGVQQWVLKARAVTRQ